MDDDVQLNTGDELEVEVDELGRKGDGIISKGDYIIVIPKVKLYGKYKIRIVKIKDNTAFAEVIG